MDNHALTNAFRRMIRNTVGRYQGPVRGKVTGQHADAGVYTVDVKVLDAEDKEDAFWPTIGNVEVPRLMFAGSDTGVFCKIRKDTIVRIGFYEGDIHRPYLDAVIGDPNASPDVGDVNMLVKSTGAVFAVTENSVTAAAGFCGVFGAVRLGGAAKDAPLQDKDGFKVMLGEEWQNEHNLHMHFCPLFGTSGPPSPPYLEETVFSQKVVVDR